MKSIKHWMLFILMLAGTASFGQTVGELYRTERINASYLIAFGRKPVDGELNYWKGQGNLSVATLVDLHKKYISGDINSQYSVVTKAFIDATSLPPGEDDIKRYIGIYKNNLTYTEVMNRLMTNLNANPSSYDKVIRASYNTVFNRDPYEGEWKHWRAQPRCSYGMLKALHETWKKQNGNTTNTSNVINPSFATRFTAVAVSAEVAREAAKVISPNGGQMVAAGGGNMVAAGGGNMVAAGGGNMVAAGGGN
jgi:hypothetical protein